MRGLGSLGTDKDLKGKMKCNAHPQQTDDTYETKLGSNDWSLVPPPPRLTCILLVE